METTAFSCVADNTPLLLAQAFLWVNCRKQIRGVAGGDIFVHTVDVDDQEFLTWLADEHVNVVATPRFHSQSPLQQNPAISDLPRYELSSSGVVRLRHSRHRRPGSARFSSDRRFHCALRKSTCFSPGNNFPGGDGLPPDWVPAALEREPTDRNNCNGGVYICDRGFLRDLEDAWRSRALWSLEHLGLANTDFILTKSALR
jgi:hypothetical protein